MSRRYLTPEQARAFYDRFGRKQDWQRIYESPAIARQLRHGAFDAARRVVELGCGTGALASELLAEHLPPQASYLGLDVSQTMVELSRERLARFGARAQVRRSDGALRVDEPAGSADRFVCNYVLDLLSPADIAAALDEIHRLLEPGGLACLLSLTHGTHPLSRALTWAWERLHAHDPALVGGCRPVDLSAYTSDQRWRVTHHSVVTALGLASQIVVAARR